MKTAIATWTQKFIHAEIVTLAFLLPLFFLPITTEFFEFNKLMLLSVAVLLGALAWGLKAALTGKWGVRQSPFDLPILAILGATLVATILSDNRLISIIGQYARWQPSLFSVMIFTGFYFLVSWHATKEVLRKALWALLASAAVAALAFWPQYFGANWLGQEWSKNVTFTPLGSPTTLAMFLGAVSGLAIKMFFDTRERVVKILLVVDFVLLVSTLALLNNIAGWVGLAASVLTAVLTSPIEGFAQNKRYLIVGLAIPLIFAAVVLVPPLFGKQTFLNRAFPTEVVLDFRTSWSVAATSFRQKPIWGSGPSTFITDFTRYKPLRFNQNRYWTVRFDKPWNEYLLAFAEQGLFGILTWIILITIFVRRLLGNRGWKLAPLGAAILAGYFVTTATIIPTFLLLLALATSRSEEESNIPEAIEEGAKKDWKPRIPLVLVLVFGALTAAWMYRAYASEVLQRKSRTIDNLAQVYNLQVRSAASFHWQANHRLTLAQTSFLVARELAKAENPSAEDEERVKSLIAQAISEARMATDLNPLSAGNWESLAQIYRSLIGLAKDAEQWATNSYQEAVALDIFNPLTRISLGGLYYQLGMFEPAAEQFRAAINLKPDYANAHYNLGIAYKELGKTNLAIQELETALNLSDPQVEGYKEAQQILNELKAE